MSNPEESSCPHCGQPLPANAPGGLCPRCLMAMNMASQTVFSGAAPEKPKSTPSPEDIASYFPNFDILECLGRGGMGVVYKARQKSLNRLVALKILAPEREKDAAFAQRFAVEAELLAKLNHPNIVTVYDFGQAAGLYYLVMELVDGVTLRRLLEGGRVYPREALAVVPQICDALQYAHDQGVVHRDIKPENIILDRRGRVKVADFGLAKLVGGAAQEPTPAATPGTPAPGLTEPGKVMGTPQYMAPEQATRPTEVDHRADIYSLGVVFYQMLTGELPGKPIEAPSRKVQIDVRLDEVVLRALEQEPGRRYTQASVLKTKVETIAATPDAGAGGGAGGVPPLISKPGFGAGSNPEQLGDNVWRRLQHRFWPPLVGLRHGQRVINWPAVWMRSLRALLALLLASAGFSLALSFSNHGIPGFFALSVLVGLFLIFAVLVLRILRGFALPLDQVPRLDSGQTPPLTAATSAPPPRNGSWIWKLLLFTAVGLIAILVLVAIGMTLAAIYIPVKRSRGVSQIEYGLVMQRNLNELDGHGGREMLDLDTALFENLTADFETLSKPQQGQWLAEHGIDIMVDKVGTEWGLITPVANAAKLAPTALEDWNTLPPGCVESVLANPDRPSKSNQSVKVYFLPSAQQWPCTYAFQTAGKFSAGLLQVIGTNQNPSGIVLRYKLLRKPGVSTNAFAPAAHFSGTFTRALNGGSVEVVGICRNPRASQRWWKPDGTPFEIPPVEIIELPKLAPTRQSSITVIPDNEFLVYIRFNQPLSSGQWKFQFKPNPSDLEFPGTIRDLERGNRASAQLICFDQPVPPEKVDLEVTTDTAQWERIASYDGQKTRDLVDGVTVVCGTPSFDEPTKSFGFEVMHNVDRNQYALRVIARLKNKTECEIGFHPGVKTGNPAKGFTTYFPGELNPSEVLDYRIERARWASVTFSGVALKPAAEP